MVMVPLSFLPLLLALFGRLDAVRHGVAQHVLERRHHALEHLAIEFAGGAFDLQLGLLVRVGGRLAHDARQALHVALERHHARAHEAVLQFGDGARLLGQQVLRVLGEVLEQLLNAADVVGGFGQRARELLDRRIAIELERIELAASALLFLVAMQDLRFGLELELAQLFLEARHRARQLADVEVDGADLLLETGARDARLAGIVEQLVEQLGVDAREFGSIGRRGRFAARRHGARRQQRPVGEPRRLWMRPWLKPADIGSFAAARVTMEGGSGDGAHTGAEHRRRGQRRPDAAARRHVRRRFGVRRQHAMVGASRLRRRRRRGGELRAPAPACGIGAGGASTGAAGRAAGVGCRTAAPARRAAVRRRRTGGRRGAGAADAGCASA